MNIVIFGGTGDLATRKLLPALFRHHKSSRLSSEVNIIGIGSRSVSNNEYLKLVREKLCEHLKQSEFSSNQIDLFLESKLSQYLQEVSIKLKVPIILLSIKLEGLLIDRST